MKVNNTIQIIGLLLLVPALFLDTTLSMMNVWIVNETFTHGFLIFPISIWMIWKKRALINRVSFLPSPIPLLAILPLLLVWLLSVIIDVKSVQQLSMIALLPPLIWALCGLSVLRMILFPLFYLFFAVPIGQGLIPPLMEFTATFTVRMIELSGIPIYRDGLYFTLPSGNWSVVEECSGVRYLIASLALGTIYSYVSYTRFHKRLIFFLLAIIVPIIANGLRAYMIVMIGHFSSMKYAVGADHLLYGWVFFGIVIFIMFYIGSFWWDDPATESTARPVTRLPKAEATPSRWLVPVTLLLLFAGTRGTAYGLLLPPEEILTPDYLRVPSQLQEWYRTEQRAYDWSPKFKNPDEHENIIYSDGSRTVNLDIGFFAYQRQGAEAVSSLNRLTNPYQGEWTLISSKPLITGTQDVREVEIQKAAQKILVWSWYRIGDQPVAKAYKAKLYEGYNKLVHGRVDASMITLSTLVHDDDISAARKILQQFKTNLDYTLFR